LELYCPHRRLHGVREQGVISQKHRLEKGKLSTKDAEIAILKKRFRDCDRKEGPAAESKLM